MNDFPSTHALVQHLLQHGKSEEALRAIGSILENNPIDVFAWQLTALALFKLGDEKTGLQNLKNSALAFAHTGNPIAALASAKLYSSLCDNDHSIVSQIADLYCAQSTRIKKIEISPPPLPKSSNIEPWNNQDTKKSMSCAIDTMAMAWGASLALQEQKNHLPYVPLLSSLDKKNCEELIKSLKREDLETGQIIINQGAIGNAMYIVAEGFVVVYHQSKNGKSTELARLGPGAFFGEMALVSSAPRAAFVKTTEKTVLLRVDKSEMESLAQRAPKIGDVLVAFCHSRMLENLMSISPVLASVSPENRPDLIARFDTDYKTIGEKIITQGQYGLGLFLIVSGKVSIIKKINDKNIIIAKLGSGDLFGEISLIMRKPSTATVIAEENTALLTLPLKEFHEATNKFPELLKSAYDIAIEREDKNNSIVGQIANKNSDLILI